MKKSTSIKIGDMVIIRNVTPAGRDDGYEKSHYKMVWDKVGRVAEIDFTKTQPYYVENIGEKELEPAHLHLWCYNVTPYIEDIVLPKELFEI